MIPVVIWDFIMISEKAKLFIELEPGDCRGTSDHEMIKFNMSRGQSQPTVHTLLLQKSWKKIWIKKLAEKYIENLNEEGERLAI